MNGQWILKPGISASASTLPPAVGPLHSNGAPGATHLTMDALLSYCETRLRDLDTQVKKVFSSQEKANADGSKLAWLQNCIAACVATGVDGNGRTVHDLVRAYQSAINEVGRDTPIGKKLFDDQQSFISTVGTNGGAELRAEMSQGDYWSKSLSAQADAGMVGKNLSPDEVKAMITRVKDLQTEINHGSELGMVTLQSLMSQRQMAIQLTTQLVQSLGEMMNKIAANIGR